MSVPVCADGIPEPAWMRNGHQNSDLPGLLNDAQQISIRVHTRDVHWAPAVLDTRHREMVWLDSLKAHT
jgi:hypothetical protein